MESVIQTAGLVRSWKEIRKAYLFLALTVGIVTPLVAILVLSANIDFKAHEGDLVTHLCHHAEWGSIWHRRGGLASFTLMMAVNTAFVASSELLERVAHRYGFHWFIVTNRRHSLYRIHLPAPLSSPSSSCSPWAARKNWPTCTPWVWWLRSASIWAP